MTTTTTNLNLRTGAGTGNSIITTIPKGATVTVTGDAWYPVTYGEQSGWVSGKYLNLDAPQEPPYESDYVSDAMALAKSMLGLWYRWGGNFTQEPFNVKNGDCSGFVGFVSDTMGYQPGTGKLYNYTADAMFDNFRNGAWKATKIEPGKEKAMDFVFYGTGTHAGHVVFAMGDGKVIGASGGGSTVTSDAAAKARNAKVRIDDIEYHSNPIIGIYRPEYPGAIGAKK